MPTETIMPDSFFIGQSGEYNVLSIFSKNQVACNPLKHADFGEDILCDISSASVKTQFSFRAQIKTTACIKKNGYIRQNKKGISISLSTGLLQTWGMSFYPVVLVVWDQSTNSGYWCFPVDQLDKSKLNQETLTIHLDYTNKFDDAGVCTIKQKVEEYYNNLYKTCNAMYRCNIYPVWMPKFRVFTLFEILKYFNSAEQKGVSAELPHTLPSFLTSYHNCNYDDSIASFEYKANSRPISQFLESIYKFLESVKFDLKKNEWVSFVVSPVEIVLDKDNRCISNITDWACFSVIDGHVYTDFEYTFGLSEDYIYSYKTRSLSDDQELFVHSSGDYAVEVFATGFSSHTRKADFELGKAIRYKSFCAIDISECSAEETKQLVEWCNDNQKNYIRLSDDKNKVFISHQAFSIMESGLLLPGVSTWEDWDNLNFDSDEFLSRIPFGKVLDEASKIRLFGKYCPNPSVMTEHCLLRLSQVLHGEALNHSDRTIRFVAYIGTIDEELCELTINQANEKLKCFIEDFELYVESYDELTDIILEIKPTYNQSTQSLVDCLGSFFQNLVLALRKNSSKQENMAYYVKYLLNRYVPDNIINNK